MRSLHGAKLRLIFLSGERLPHARGSHSLTRRRDEESRHVRVSVWWDFENCHVPAGMDPCRIAGTIANAVRANGIRGPIEITAFGDMLMLSRAKQEGLSATGINLTHVPGGSKNSADRSLLLSLMFWVSQNPPPAHLLLISGDQDFASTLHRLRMSNYNILLAATRNTPGILCSAASIMWDWGDLVKGENLAGKCFNQPPDGPHGSWYGQYKGPILDPFANPDNSEELETVPDFPPKTDAKESCPKPGPIPEEVVKKIQKILESNPEGISATNLRRELDAVLNLDKTYYGYNRLLPFLSALSDILRIRNISCGHYTIHGVHQYNSSEPEIENLPSNPPLSKFLENISSEKIQKTSDLDESTIEVAAKSDEKVAGKVDTPESSESFLSRDGKIVETVSELESESPVISPEPGFFRRFWRKLSGNESPELQKREEKDVEMNPKPSVSVYINDEEQKDKICAKDEDSVDNKPIDPGFLDRVKNFCKFHNSSDPEKPTDKEAEPKLFQKDSFWISVESFLNTPQGSVLVSESTTREKMANELRSKGPEPLQSLGETDMLRLVNRLISEKKWVEESALEIFPFKLARGYNTTSSSPPERSREEVLAACQTLVNEVLKEHPGGFFVGLFRKLFLERYGYHLDLHQLGFPKLAGLLRTMSGLKIESGYIVPCNENLKNSPASDFEELGPVASEKFDFEPAVSDDELSDSVETRSKDRVFDENGGSLLQILDSWHAGKGDPSPERRLSLAETMRQVPARSKGRKKQRCAKTLAFVTDSGSENDDKIVNDILGNLRKPVKELGKKENDAVFCN